MFSCEIFNKLYDIYYPLKQQLDDNPEPCCWLECCEGLGDCEDNDCCNEDGNKPMGTCWCKDENIGYEPPSEKLQNAVKLANDNLGKHMDNCETCIKNKDAPLFQSEVEK